MKNLIAAFLLLVLGSAANAACGPDAPPVDAAAAGLTCEVFVDTMTDISKFDVNDTRVQGFNWYVHQAWPNAAATGVWQTAFSPTPPTDYTVSGSGTLLSPVLDNYPISLLSTCAYSGIGLAYVGTAFQAPFYIDVTFTYSGSSQGPQWPAVWMAPTEFMTAGSGAQNVWSEIDMFESPFVGAIHEWRCNIGFQGCANQESYVTDQHTSVSGMMLLTGSMTRYQNDVPYDVLTFGPSIQPSGTTGTHCCGANPAGTYKRLGTNHYCLMLAAGPGQPMTVTKVAVWAAPTTPNTGPEVRH